MARPKERSDNPQAKNTASRIVDVAATLFAEKGYAATTTREIAETAHLERASLYHHINSKEDLLYQICHDSLEEGLRVLRGLDPEKSALERIGQLIEFHVATLLKNRAANVTMLLEMRSLTGARLVEIIAMRDTYEALIGELIVEGQQAGSITTTLPPRMMVLSLLNMLNWSLVWYSEGQRFGPNDLSRTFSSIFLDGALFQDPAVAN